MTRSGQGADRSLRLAEGNAPVHDRLARAIETSIAGKGLRPGDRLPTHREIAKRSGVAIGTVTKAIDSLARRGVVRGEVGRGTFVAGPDGADADETLDLSINAPPSVVSADVLAAAADRAARKAAALPMGGYGDVAGWPAHRATLAGWLSAERLPATADEVIITVGAQHGLFLAFSDRRRTSEVVVTEPATFPGAIAIARELGMRMIPCPVDDEGMIPAALAEILERARGATLYTTPVCQNPMGFETGGKRRAEILETCRAFDAGIVEDDIYGLYASTDAEPYKALAPDRVHYLTSLSKCMTPLVRVGLLVPPPARRPALLAAMRAQTWATAPICAALACELVENGACRTARDWLRSEVAERHPAAMRRLGIRPGTPPAPHAWLPMSLAEAEAFARRALDVGLRVTPPTSSLVDVERGAGIRLCILTPTTRTALDKALALVSGLIGSRDQPIV